jgi:hypothetical protein
MLLQVKILFYEVGSWRPISNGLATQFFVRNLQSNYSARSKFVCEMPNIAKVSERSI